MTPNRRQVIEVIQKTADRQAAAAIRDCLREIDLQAELIEVIAELGSRYKGDAEREKQLRERQTARLYAKRRVESKWGWIADVLKTSDEMTVNTIEPNAAGKIRASLGHFKETMHRRWSVRNVRPGVVQIQCIGRF